MEKLKILNYGNSSSRELAEEKSGNIVAVVYGDNDKQSDERSAILAAAPALLEACKEAYEELGALNEESNMSNDKRGHYCGDLVLKMRAAIAAASESE